MNDFSDPTKEELAKAVYELSVLYGILPSKEERDYVRFACTRLVTGWALHNAKPEGLEAWLDTPGVIKQASEKGYQKHLGLEGHG